MTTGAGRAERLVSAGSTTARPLLVVNHSRPSAVWHEAGCRPPEHFSVNMPSLRSYVRHGNGWPVSANPFSALLAMRKMPPDELIQRFPNPSSSMSQMKLLGNPFFGSDGGKSAVFKPAHAAAIGADP